MEAHDPSQNSLGRDIALTAHMAIDAVDDQPPPRRIESNRTVHGVADLLGCLAAENAAYRTQHETAGEGSITVEHISQAAISILRSQGVKVGYFRRRKIRKILSV